MRTLLGWVDRETWDLKQAKLGQRKEAKRDKPRFYHTSKANYKWVFHDPTGELQQRFDDQKKQSYLRLLPSWMRSYPHGSTQPSKLAEQDKPPKGIYQLPELQSSTHGRLSRLEPLEYTQLDGYPMSGVVRDPYRLPALPIMEYPDAIVPSALGKSCLLTKLPMMVEPDVVQVWRIQENPLPERVSSPIESEQELEGEAESQETAIQRVTEQALREGRSLEAMNQTMHEPRDGVERPLLPIITTPLPRHPRVRSGQPVRDPRPPGSESENFLARRQRYIEDLERRIQEVRADPILMLVPSTIGDLMEELNRARGARPRQAPIASRPPVPDPPVPENICHANRHDHQIEELERRINNLQTELTSTPVLGTPDSLLRRLLEARAARGRTDHIANQRSAVPGMTMQDPDDAQIINAVDGLRRLTVENIQNHLRDFHNRHRDSQNRPDVLHVQAHVTNINAFRRLYQVLTITRANLAPVQGPAHPGTQRLFRNIQNANSSTPPTVTPQTHGEATGQTAAFYNDSATGRSDSAAPDIRIHDFQAENDAALTATLSIRSSSDPALPSPTGTATQASATATPSSPEVDDALNEELYTDVYP